MSVSRLVTNSNPSQPLLSRTTWSALAALMLTTVHHVYGAYVYDTPWRLHAAHVSALVAVAIAGSRLVLRRSRGNLTGRIAFGVFALLTLVVPVLLIGIFEGAYNHVLKNALYFAGASPALMGRLFPPPTYELPNDAFFEITGVLQVVPTALAAWYLYRATHQRRVSNTIRLRAGDRVSPRELMSIRGEPVAIPHPGGLMHLQFRRFAGCPVCNLHLQSFVRRRNEIATAGIREVIVFHSTVDDLMHYEEDVPFAVVADPDKRLYTAFGVEASPRALLDPHVWLRIVRAVLHSLGQIIRERRPIPPIRPKGGSLGLPADFLIAAEGRVIASKYGVHADDQWSVDELLQLALPSRSRALVTARPASALGHRHERSGAQA